MSSMQLRECRSHKECSNCGTAIEKGSSYYSGAFKALCVDCHEKPKAEVSKPKSEDSSYILPKQCEYCNEAPIGVLWNKPVCIAHINAAITENV